VLCRKRLFFCQFLSEKQIQSKLLTPGKPQNCSLSPFWIGKWLQHSERTNADIEHFIPSHHIFSYGLTAFVRQRWGSLLDEARSIPRHFTSLLPIGRKWNICASAHKSRRISNITVRIKCNLLWWACTHYHYTHSMCQACTFVCTSTVSQSLNSRFRSASISLE